MYLVDDATDCQPGLVALRKVKGDDMTYKIGDGSGGTMEVDGDTPLFGEVVYCFGCTLPAEACVCPPEHVDRVLTQAERDEINRRQIAMFEEGLRSYDYGDKPRCSYEAAWTEAMSWVLGAMYLAAAIAVVVAVIG
jgi:hypothetical protein